jgi:hypothetical protein
MSGGGRTAGAGGRWRGIFWGEGQRRGGSLALEQYISTRVRVDPAPELLVASLCKVAPSEKGLGDEDIDREHVAACGSVSS